MGKEPDGHQVLTLIKKIQDEVAAEEATERSVPRIFEVDNVLMGELV